MTAFSANQSDENEQINQLISAYRQIQTSTIGHFTSIGYLPDIKAIHPCTKVYAGAVMTVTLKSANTEVIRQALMQAQCGDVLCIDARGLDERACWGALRTCAAIYEQLTAVIILGKVTDTLTLKQLEFPIFAKGVSALTTSQSHGDFGDIGRAIDYTVGHYATQIRSNDLAVMDDDGVFVLSASKAKQYLNDCINKQKQDDDKLNLFMQAYKSDNLTALAELANEQVKK